MKLILTLSITCTLLYTVDMQCHVCANHGCTITDLQTCSPEQTCVTATFYHAEVTNGFTNTQIRVVKGCFYNSSDFCPSLNKRFDRSVNVGFVRDAMTVFCCDTNGCNSETLAAPTEPNGLNCYSCDNTLYNSCDTNLKCLGVEDHCFMRTYGHGPMGCLSSNFCNDPAITCCTSDRCNKAADVLQCQTCLDEECETTALLNCYDGVCFTQTNVRVTNLHFTSTKTSVIKGCMVNYTDLCPSLNKRYSQSINVGFVRSSTTLLCCDSEDCNGDTLPAPSDKPNGLHCYSCNDSSLRYCDTNLQCLGDEDHCFNKTFREGALLGCVSGNICENEAEPDVCCDCDLCNQMGGNKPCNGAERTQLSFLRLMLALPFITLLW